MSTQETIDTSEKTKTGQPTWVADEQRPLMQRTGERAELERRGTGARRGARGLGWFSVGLGTAQLIAPRGLASLLGLRDSDGASMLLRVLGAREVANGVAILRGQQPGRWLWARVAGDAMDLALLGAAMGTRRAEPGRLAAASAAVAGVAILDLLAARRITRDSQAAESGIDVRRSITIDKSPEEIYRFWRTLENLPRFMVHLESVEKIDERRSRWTARGPASVKVEWDAEIVHDRKGERIAWQSLEGADVNNTGEVRFVKAPGGRGTEVHVALRYWAPAGAVGAALLKLLGKEPGQQIDGDLRRLKQVLEIGEVMHSDASIHRGPHPGRPSKTTPELPPTRKGGV